MSYFMVDVETDGPIPGDYSMIEIGAIVVDETLEKTFYAKIRPISEKYITESLSISGYSREETLLFDDPLSIMRLFSEWIASNTQGKPLFISDNNGFDWMFICWYFHHFLHENPFGYSSINLGSLYKGVVKDMTKSFKHLRKTNHSHNPVDDVRGNAEALLAIRNDLELKIQL